MIDGYEDLTMPIHVTKSGAVYVNAFGEHKVPLGLLLKCQVYGYGTIKKWMKDVDKSSEEAWRAGTA